MNWLSSPARPWQSTAVGRSEIPMALVVFLRGVNVGGHRTFRPSVLANDLSAFDVVNVGAAGTFVVRKPESTAKFRAALLAKLPFETEVMICDGRRLSWLGKKQSVWKDGTQARHGSLHEYSAGSRTSQSFDPDNNASRWPMAVAGCGGERPLPFRYVSAAHEDDRLSWATRQSVRYAGDDTELEHHRDHHEDSERGRNGTRSDPAGPRSRHCSLIRQHV